jgi:3,4-dihydroxy 2-butanone 4-phosphate synthase/GTP cyclohydrolase II
MREARGLLCVAMDGRRLDDLELCPMTDVNTGPQGTAFTVSVDAAGVSTGMSAADRARTVRALIDPATRPGDLLRPGHVFPLRAAAGGLRERQGHTEAAVTLCRIADLAPAAGIVEIINPDGSMARARELERFAATHRLGLVTVADVLDHLATAGDVPTTGDSPAARRPVVAPRRAAESWLPTEHGTFRLVAYEAAPGRGVDLALTLGDPAGPPPLVRIHSECLTGDVLGSLRCDCGPQLGESLGRIGAEGRGILIYVRQEGRGIGLRDKIRAYALQDGGLDTVDANLALGYPPDLRDYRRAATILVDLGIGRVRLLTNNPAKAAGLVEGGIEVDERIPLEIPAVPTNRAYLATKAERLGHLLRLVR